MLIVDPAAEGAFDGWWLGSYAVAFGAALSSICAGAAISLLVRTISAGVIVAVMAFAALYVLIPVIG